MSMVRVFMSLATATMIISTATAASYNVGGPSGGWDMTTDVQTWATSQLFVTGDNLVFQYMPSHDVVEVTKADYDSCQVTNPLHSYHDGNTVVTLASPGKRYFICTTMGHCAQGMKLEVNTLASSSITLPPAIAPVLAPASSVQAPIGSPLGNTLASSSITLPPAIAPVLAPESSVQAPIGSPLGSHAQFPFISSVESPMSSSTSKGSALQSSEFSSAVANSLTQAVIGLGFGVVMILMYV